MIPKSTINLEGEIKMRFKNYSILIFGIVFSMSTLSGCGSQKNISGNKSAKPVTISFSFWGAKDEIAMKQDLIKEYESLHPNVKINGSYTDGGTYPTKLQTYFSSNTAPDVISIAADISSDFVTQGVFEDLTPYIKKDNLQNGTWEKGVLGVFTNKNSIYAAPYDYKIPAIVYNKNIFDKAGIPYPKDVWTEDDLMKDAKIMTTGTGISKIDGINLSWWPSLMARNMYGDPVYDVANKKITAEGNGQLQHALELFKNMIYTSKVAPNDAEAKSIGGGFETGKFAMAIVAPFDIDGFQKLIGDKFGWDIVRFPVNATYGRWKSDLFADGVGISSKSKNKDAAWDYVKWLTTDVTAQEKTSSIGVPTLKTYANSDKYLNQFPAGSKPYNKKVFINATENAVPFYSTGIFAKINDVITNQYNLVVSGKATVDNAIAGIQNQGTADLK